MSRLVLEVRTPLGPLFEGEVSAIRAEDRSGWFGIRAGREAVIAVLPPGLLLFRDGEGDGFIALAGGLLSHEGERCRVLAREAVLARTLDAIADQLAAQLARRGRSAELQRDAVQRLAREALRRMVQEARA